MKAYVWNLDNIYCGEIEVEPDPLEEGKYLLPQNTTLISPHDIPNGKYAKWNGLSWDIIDAEGKDLNDSQINYRLSEIDRIYGVRCFRDLVTSGSLIIDQKALEHIIEAENEASILRNMLKEE